ncbi:MAG: hypothetical protein R6V54_13015 [Desulfobacteraceae bacterium]
MITTNAEEMVKMMGKVLLDLANHCIETEIRREYKKRVSACLNSREPDDSLEAELELLKAALEQFDFSFLRATYPSLAGGRKERVCLVSKGFRTPGVEINGQEI